MSVTEINSATQFETLLKSNTYVVVDFYADWCGPCHAIRPMVEKLASAHSTHGHLTFVKVNVDKQPSIAQQYGVSAMPTFLFLHNGKQYAGTPMIRGADAQGLGRVVQELGRLAKDAQKAENEKAQREADAAKADDGSTVSGGYTMGTSGKRSDWKMSLTG